MFFVEKLGGGALLLTCNPLYLLHLDVVPNEVMIKLGVKILVFCHSSSFFSFFNADIVFSVRDASDDMVLPVGLDDYRHFLQIQPVLERPKP